jgi:hypothetical protein
VDGKEERREGNGRLYTYRSWPSRPQSFPNNGPKEPSLFVVGSQPDMDLPWVNFLPSSCLDLVVLEDKTYMVFSRRTPLRLLSLSSMERTGHRVPYPSLFYSIQTHPAQHLHEHSALYFCFCRTMTAFQGFLNLQFGIVRLQWAWF